MYYDDKLNKIDILEMCKLAHDFNPKLFKKKMGNPFSRGESSPTFKSDIGFIMVVCISSLFSGTRFYYSNERYNIYGGQGVESFEVKSKEMCHFNNICNEAYFLMKASKWHMNRLRKITTYVDTPIDEFFNNSNDGEGGEIVIYGGWEFNPDKTFRRLFVEWHGCSETSIETFMHFYEHAVRIRECIPMAEALLKAYKKSHKIKGDGINEKRNYPEDNSSLGISA